MKKFLIIGGSDAGISAALRARELKPETEVTMLLADRFPNFSICGLFVKMHEENNLVYAADRLLHLRKLAKKMIEEEQKSGLNPVKDMLGDLLKLRDNVLLAPCPAPDDPARCQNYQSALKTLSAQLDELAISAVNGNQAGAENILKNLMPAIIRLMGLRYNL
ncbi:MAG: hypothetical protein SCK70_02400 [bacterium]|nr:hypothetical protein [bacterium]